MSIGSEYQVSALSGGEYYNFVLALIIIFGVSFEVPLIIIMLNLAGLLEYEQVKDKRRIIIVALFIFAAFMTPGQDPFSMIVLALSLCFLVEMAFQFCRINDKRRKKKTGDWGDMRDDEASGPIAPAEPISAAAPVSTPTPVASPAPRPVDDFNKPGYFDDVL